MWLQEDYTTDEEALAAHGVKGGAGGILDLLKASKQVAGLDSSTLRLEMWWFSRIHVFQLFVLHGVRSYVPTSGNKCLAVLLQ